MPMEQPTEFDLVVNLKVADELGIKIPSILMRATPGAGQELARSGRRHPPQNSPH